MPETNSQFSLYHNKEVIARIEDIYTDERESTRRESGNTTDIHWNEQPYAVLRLIPDTDQLTWDKEKLNTLTQKNAIKPFGDCHGFENVKNKYGLISLDFSLIDEIRIAHHITQLCFYGEIWGFNNLILGSRRGSSEKFIPYKKLETEFIITLDQYLEFINTVLDLPREARVVFGLVNVNGYKIPIGSSKFSAPIINDKIIHEDKIEPGSCSENVIKPFIHIILNHINQADQN